jgi:hypothetical protein
MADIHRHDTFGFRGLVPLPSRRSFYYHCTNLFQLFLRWGGGVEAKAGKIKPNEKCPCGSGKKYKKCHGAN